MKTERDGRDHTSSFYCVAVGVLTLALCLGLSSAVAAQDQSTQHPADQEEQSPSSRATARAQSPDATAPTTSPDSTPPPSDNGVAPQTPAQPSSGWHYNPGPERPAPENPTPQSTPPDSANSPQSAPPTSDNPPAPEAAAPQGPLPNTLTLPPGAVVSVRLREWLSSDHNHAGDTFSAELDQPIVVDGWVVARRGQSVLGRVALAQKANHGNNESKLGVELAEITLVDGEQLPVSTELQQDSKTRSTGRDAATVGVTTAIGAIIGAAIGGGQGAVIGAGAGVGAGMATIMVTPGRPTVLHPEQLLSFRLQSPLEISTDRGHVAFQPVTQADYGRDQQADAANRPQLRRYPPRSPYAPYPYPYAPYGPVMYPPYYYGYCARPSPWGCYYRR